MFVFKCITYLRHQTETDASEDPRGTVHFSSHSVAVQVVGGPENLTMIDYPGYIMVI